MILTYKDECTLEQAIDRVSEYGCSSEIRFFDIQPIELCLAAVRQDGFALDYVRDQTPEICLEVAKKKHLTCRLLSIKVEDE